jgi:hypothetical protein
MKRLIGTALVAACATLASGCGESPEDQARKAGEQIGQDLASIRTATSAEEVGKALDDINAEVERVKEDLPTGLSEQLTAIKDEFVENAQAATDPASRRAAYLDAASQMNTLASDTNSVINEFRRGVKEGLVD